MRKPFKGRVGVPLLIRSLGVVPQNGDQPKAEIAQKAAFRIYIGELFANS